MHTTILTIRKQPCFEEATIDIDPEVGNLLAYLMPKLSFYVVTDDVARQLAK